MAIESDSGSWQAPVPPEEIEMSRGRAYWTVADLRWDRVAPELPAEVVDLLAPLQAVSAERYTDPQPTQPDDDDTERWPAPGDPCARVDRTPRFLAPAPLRARRHRRAFARR